MVAEIDENDDVDFDVDVNVAGAVVPRDVVVDVYPAVAASDDVSDKFDRSLDYVVVYAIDMMLIHVIK